MAQVKDPSLVVPRGVRRSGTRISSKNQVTLPVAQMRAAGLRPGDVLLVRADGQGRLVLERAEDVIGEVAGALTGVYTPGELDRMRDEWD